MTLQFNFYVVLIAFLLSPPAYAAEISGHVVAVADGDTITLLVDRQQVRVRLADIDAPERKQAFGNRSRQSLHGLCHGKSASIEVSGKDRYGRVIGTATCDSQNANAEQVRRGMAWVYDRYAHKDSPLYALQEMAKATKAGLWVDAEPVPPWDWRRSKQ
jgi:endonuclease YncB( thermonuclease family)